MIVTQLGTVKTKLQQLETEKKENEGIVEKQLMEYSSLFDGERDTHIQATTNLRRQHRDRELPSPSHNRRQQVGTGQRTHLMPCCGCA